MKKKIIFYFWIAIAIGLFSECAPNNNSKNQEVQQQVSQEQQEIEDESKLKPVENGKMYTVNGVSFNMIDVKGGTFTMGNTDYPSWVGKGTDELDNFYSQQVTLNDFAIGQTEVTCDLWKAVMGDFPLKRITKGTRAQIDARDAKIAEQYKDGYPMAYISYEYCMEFIKKLNEITGEKFRLPTEAEWEYAAAGGQADCHYIFSGSDIIDDVAWFNCKSTHPVMQLKPNQLGIYDMSGNVEELCEDFFDFKRDNWELSVVQLPPATNPVCRETTFKLNSHYSWNGLDKKKIFYRVVKGGSFKSYVTGELSDLYIHNRYFKVFHTTVETENNSGYEGVGFRLAR